MKSVLLFLGSKWIKYVYLLNFLDLVCNFPGTIFLFIGIYAVSKSIYNLDLILISTFVIKGKRIMFSLGHCIQFNLSLLKFLYGVSASRASDLYLLRHQIL